MRRILFISIFFCSLSSGFGQAWTQNTGQGFYKLDFSSIRSSDLFNDAGDVVSSTKQWFDVFSFYGEHGIGDRLELMTYIPYVRNNLLGFNTVSESGLGDIDIALKYAITRTGVAVSTSLLLGIPSGDGSTISGLNTGDGEFNQMVKVNAGSGGNRWWVQTGVAYNNRTKDFADEVRFNAEFGLKLLNNKLLTVLKVNAIQPFDQGDRPVNNFGLYSNKVAYVSPSLEFMYYATDRIGLVARGASAVSGRNVQAAPQFSFGVFTEVK